ncbi:MAG: sigma-70 family RNA polymerase sigma factor [Parvularculaceae bacterium]
MGDRVRISGDPDDPVISERLKAVEDAIRLVDPLLVSWLAKKLRDAVVARDIAQEAYLRVWRFAHDTPIDDPRALLFKAAANLAANEFKARRRARAERIEPPLASRADPAEAVAADAPSPEREECARQDLAACRKVIAELPEKARRAFVLSRFEELTYREIAEQLGVSESSVEKYIILALKKLRNSPAAKNAGREQVATPKSAKKAVTGKSKTRRGKRA